MRRLREWRLLTAAAASLVAIIQPAAALSHGIAHHREDDHAHHHVQSLDFHDGSNGFAAPDDADSHPHSRVDRAARAAAVDLLSPGITSTAPDFSDPTVTETTPLPCPEIHAPDPPGNAPPRLRSPPLR